jgi:hypothetical protein
MRFRVGILNLLEAQQHVGRHSATRAHICQVATPHAAAERCEDSQAAQRRLHRRLGMIRLGLHAHMNFKVPPAADPTGAAGHGRAGGTA